MIAWKNLDTLPAYARLSALKDRVNLPEAMSGEAGAERVARYSVPMAAGLTYNYAAKAVDDEVLAALAQLAEQLGISRAETAAIGDSDNDVTMLRWGALSVAMGGAPNHVCASARFQTDDCDHDGLAKAVEMLMGLE